MSEHNSENSALRVAIVGGGASGVLAALALAAEARPCDVFVIDPKPGRGVAYGGPDLRHLLNTRAAAMTVDAAAPEDFSNWLAQTRPLDRDWTPTDFAPRRVFGDYLEARFTAAVTGAPSATRIRPVTARAEGLERRGEAWRVKLAGGRSVAADVVILATGNAPPRILAFPGRDEVDDLVIDNPWDAAALAAASGGAHGQQRVVLVGSGLTAIDAWLSLQDGDQGPDVVMVSRRGLTPRTHGTTTPGDSPVEAPFPARITDLQAIVREAISAAGGEYQSHAVLHALRCRVSDIWRSLATEERRRFLRHLRPWWEVERHRLAPEIAALMATAEASGRLVVRRGRISGARRDGDRAQVRIEGRDGQVEIAASRIVNCTGPDQDVRRAGNPVIRDALALGAVACPLGLGLDVDPAANLKDADGAPIRGLYALGSLTRGTFFEITALPDIRDQAAGLARRLAGAASARRAA